MDWIKTLVMASALVLTGYFIGNMHVSAKKFDRHVQVKGLSEREVAADLAVWPIQITVMGNDLKSLKTEIEKQKTEVTAFFNQQGFGKDELSIGTTNIVDSKANIYNNNNQYREHRYIAKTEFTIRTKAIDKLKTALSESLDLISKGILIGSKNTWRPIEYIYTKLNDIKPSMVEEATLKAREVAEKFATDSNSKVGKIKSANQGLFTISNRDENSPEIKIVRVVSTVDYFIEE